MLGAKFHRAVVKRGPKVPDLEVGATWQSPTLTKISILTPTIICSLDSVDSFNLTAISMITFWHEWERSKSELGYTSLRSPTGRLINFWENVAATNLSNTPKTLALAWTTQTMCQHHYPQILPSLQATGYCSWYSGHDSYFLFTNGCRSSRDHMP